MADAGEAEDGWKRGVEDMMERKCVNTSRWKDTGLTYGFSFCSTRDSRYYFQSRRKEEGKR